MSSTMPEEILAPEIKISSPEEAMAPVAGLASQAPALRGPLRHVLRGLVVLILIGFLVYILQDGIRTAFMTNPGLNGLIVGVLAVGILIGFAEFWRVSRAATHGTMARREETPLPIAADPIMAPIAHVLRQGSSGAIALEAMSLRLDEGRETLRYLAGLLVFLGLLGTFWGLLETVSSVGNVIKSLRTGGEAGVLFDELKSGLAAPLAGMGLSFSSSLFGIAGSLVLGFLDLQLGQAQRRLRTDAEDWLAGLPTAESPPQAGVNYASSGTATAPFPIAEFNSQINRLIKSVNEGTGGRAASDAMANLAEGVQSLVQHMRAEQQMIRDWVEAQAERERELKRLLDRLAAHEKLN